MSYTTVSNSSKSLSPHDVKLKNIPTHILTDTNNKKSLFSKLFKKKIPYCEEKDDNGEYKNNNADLEPDEKFKYILLMKGFDKSKYKGKELIEIKKKLANEFYQCDDYRSDLMNLHIRAIGGKKRKTKKTKKTKKSKKSKKSRKTRKLNH